MAAAATLNSLSIKEKENLEQQRSYKLLLDATMTVLKDDEFDLPSEKAVKARLCADRLLKWIDQGNQKAAQDFAISIYLNLKSCCTHTRKVKFRTLRQRLWGKFYKYCSSDEHMHSWASFIKESTGMKACPIFYQFINKYIMEKVISEDVFPCAPLQDDATTVNEDLSYEEANAIRYTAGYVVRSLTEKVQRSSHLMKEEILLCLKELREEQTGGDDSADTSINWTKRIDRGGLVHIGDGLYMAFVSLELEVRKHLTIKTTSIDKKKVMESLLENDDVGFYWTMVAINWTEEVSRELLRLISELWITIRGFSHVSGFLELYKQERQETLQKSKSLRRKLVFGSSASGNE